jgi:hypothetical protein
MLEWVINFIRRSGKSIAPVAMKIIPQITGSARNLFVAALLGGGLVTALLADEPKAGAPDNTNAVATVAASPAVKRVLTGAELYSIHCNRCHPERYPTERTAAQWKTIMLHMQVRASIPGKQAKLILQYLQENSGR